MGLLPSGNHSKSLEEQKRKFVYYSRKFSTTLRLFFKDNNPGDVFSSANLLVNQTNLILFVIRDLG
ncbi:unnamed protein product [Protopolystoma xenopodis]|uniref:Uncharacterized protein n=1 Tax=Protopolystoma xenopodis TaxID=117903 RepID=A0A448X791_9PLAT|nr:unnamed protein product [Protopolystoma xenopodis]